MKTIDIVFDGPPGPVSPRFVEVEREGRSIRIGEWKKGKDPYWYLSIPYPERQPGRKPNADPLDLQNAEFDAANEFAKQLRRVQLTAVVDDDYPSVRHDYEGALRGLIKALQDNGRIP